MSTKRRDIFDEIVWERTSQDKKWGGPAHDDTHLESDWCRYIATHNDLALENDSHGHFRKQMIRVAALAVAAIEWYDRKREPSR